jgi:hypothetical protein
VKVHDSALKHGVLPEDAAQAADWPPWVEPLDEEDWPHRALRLGSDTQAPLLEKDVRDVSLPCDLAVVGTGRDQFGDPPATRLRPDQRQPRV